VTYVLQDNCLESTFKIFLRLSLLIEIINMDFVKFLRRFGHIIVCFAAWRMQILFSQTIKIT